MSILLQEIGARPEDALSVAQGICGDVIFSSKACPAHYLSDLGNVSMLVLCNAHHAYIFPVGDVVLLVSVKLPGNSAAVSGDGAVLTSLLIL